MTPDSGVRETSHRAQIAAIVLIGFLAFGLYLVTDVRVADDWMYLKWMEGREWQTFKYFHAIYNDVWWVAAIWPMSYFPDVELALRVFSVAVILSNGIVVYLLGCITRYCSRMDCLFIAALSVVYPAFMWHVSVIYSVIYNFPVLIFYFGLYLAVRSEASPGMRRHVFHALSLLAFLYSFHVGSLLVFFYGAAILHIAVIASVRSLSWRKAIGFYCTRRIDFLICPVFFRFGYEILSHPFVNNPAHLDAGSFQNGLMAFLGSVSLQAKAVFLSPVFGWAVLLSVAGLLLARWARRSGLPSLSGVDTASARQAALQLAFGLFLFVCAIFPYIAVAKTPDASATLGYTTRTLLLAQVPAGIVLNALARLIGQAMPVIRSLTYPILVGVIASSIGIQIRENLKWQYYGVLDRSFAFNLAKTPKARDITYFIVLDRTGFMPFIHHPVASLPFEVAQIFHGTTHVFGDLPFEYDIAQAHIARKSLATLVAEYDILPTLNLVDAWQLTLPTEYRQGVLVVCRGPTFGARSNNALVAYYQYDRWIDKSALDGLIAPLLELRLITKSPQDLISDCPR